MSSPVQHTGNSVQEKLSKYASSQINSPIKRHHTEMEQEQSETQNDKKHCTDLSIPEQLVTMVKHVMEQNNSLAEQFKSIKEDNKREYSQLREENQVIKKSVGQITRSQQIISKEVNDLKQESINNSIEIFGIDTTSFANKSPMDVFSDLLSSYEIPFNPMEVARIFKREITIANQKKSILTVSFKGYEEKMRIMRAKFEKDERRRAVSIFFNHALTPANRELLKKAKESAKKHGLRVSIAVGKIYMKKPGETRGTPIKSSEDIHKLEAELIRNNEQGKETQSNVDQLQ